MVYKYFTLSFLCLFVSQTTFSQKIAVNSNFTPQELIENNLVIGCVEVSNIVSNINGSIDNLTSYGYFERNNSNFPFENGIVLSTGSSESAGNSTNENPLHQGTDAWATDTDLETALGITNTVNATSIEFDFISISNQIQFNYILASEEYFAEYPCGYSDGFAFLLKESGSTAYTNIALLPRTNIPVNTSTIHDEIVGHCPAQNEQYFDGYNMGDTNFNGRTKVLTASAATLPNVQYRIKLIIADQDDTNYDSAVFIEGHSFSASIDLGPDINTCAETITLNANTNNPLTTYSWYNNGVLEANQNESTLVVNQSGNYSVEAIIPINNTNCFIQDDILVTLNSEQAAGALTDFELCDDISADGIETFNLTIKDAEILASVPPSNYNISYHLENSHAQNNTNAVTAPIQNSGNPQIIYVRIEDMDNGCLAYSSFNLVVNALPNITTPSPLNICDDTISDGMTQIDLSTTTNQITGGNFSYIVNYHYTQADADIGANPIPLPYTNSNPSEQLFVSILDTYTGCINTTNLTINVLSPPNINTGTVYLDACEQDDDGIETFDLSTSIDDVLQGLTGVSTSFHTTYQDAQNGDNPIVDIQNYENTNPNTQTIFIRVIDDITGCVSITEIDLYTNFLAYQSDDLHFYTCDDASNDGIATFDLIDIANNAGNVTVTFFETEDDQTNNISIDQTLPYTVSNSPHTLFATLESATCIHATTVQLIINPAVVIQALDPVNYCDTDDDGFTAISLEEFDDYVGQGIPNPVVSYFLNETDANNNENVLPPLYTNLSNPQILYTRVSTNTGCFDVSAIEINIIPAPTTTQPNNIIVCDNNQDAFSIVNLEDTIPETVSSLTDLDISFHTSLDNAHTNTDAINNPSAYNANTQTIYTRVENTITTCFALVTFEIFINTLPEFTAIENFRHCETDGNEQADFIFNEKDVEILNGQQYKDVLYFTDPDDAINRVNIIDKNVAYQNESNPQTIYVRVENTSDISCFGTSSFQIEVGSIPIFNSPTNWVICDDSPNDGFEIFDLSEKIDEMSATTPQNLDITFHSSFDDAENQVNELPLQYTNTSNPQQIYARVENGTYCHAIAEFGLNIVQLPIVNTASPQQRCDTDTDGFTQFDLTIAEVEVLDVRQDNIMLTYHPSFNDAENHTNIIANPDNYTNISNPQTVYLKVTNTVSNCFVSVPIELKVDVPPTINNIQPIEVCDNTDHTFNLSDISIDTLIGNQDNVSISFYTNNIDAQNAQNEIIENYAYTSNNDIIFVRAENTILNCFNVGSFILQVNSSPTINTIQDLESCDDDYDGFMVFDFSQQTPFILGGLDPNLFSVSYFEQEADAIENNNAIVVLNHNAANNQTFYTRLTNNATGCFSMSNFNTIIHRKPVVDIPDQTICLNNLPLVVSAETNIDGDTYAWSTNESTPEIEIASIGTYSATVTTAYGCTTTATFNVTESEQATIIFTEQVNFSTSNSITITTVSGIGDYLYSLDNGIPQESNYFDNVTLGPHIITVLDRNGCTSTTKDIVIIDAPLFFTPNNDGYNDSWHITGVEQLTGTLIYIFDRYGKLLKTLSHSTPGWDGTYNGELMPTSDYWFLAHVKYDDSEFEVKRHFTLKR